VRAEELAVEPGLSPVTGAANVQPHQPVRPIARQVDHCPVPADARVVGVGQVPECGHLSGFGAVGGPAAIHPTQPRAFPVWVQSQVPRPSQVQPVACDRVRGHRTLPIPKLHWLRLERARGQSFDDVALEENEGEDGWDDGDDHPCRDTGFVRGEMPFEQTDTDRESS
jgi:hypothetical protein